MMPRAKHVLLPAACTVAFAVATPALALNPQPLPPGFQQPTTFQAGKYFAHKAGGSAYSALIVKGYKSHAR